jgi:hypothetical protein
MSLGVFFFSLATAGAAATASNMLAMSAMVRRMLISS